MSRCPRRTGPRARAVPERLLAPAPDQGPPARPRHARSRESAACRTRAAIPRPDMN